MNEKFLTEKINYYKFWLAFIITADVSTAAWVYKNLKILSVSNFILISVILISLTCAIVIINNKSRILLKNLENNKNGN